MRPVYKIEVYSPLDQLKYTFGEGGLSEGFNIKVKEVLTSNVGTFSFSVPTKKGISYKYSDINLYDKVKIWLGYKNISGDPLTVGRIYQINGPLTTETGLTRLFSGRNQGEILHRRIKYHTQWEGVGVSTIVTALANDLGLGTGQIESDSTPVTMTVGYGDTYFNILKKVSDYWYDADTQIKKDFYVDVNNNLVWKSRPLRTEGIETFTQGVNIIAYNVTRDLDSVKNKIKIYGDLLGGYPSDLDYRTEQAGSETPADDGWVSDSVPACSFEWNSTYKVVGNESLRAYKTSYDVLNFHNTSWAYPGYLEVSDWKQSAYKRLRFWLRLGHSGGADASFIVLYIWAPNSSNRFQKVLPNQKNGEWIWHDLVLGPKGGWKPFVGSPNWSNIQAVYWAITWPYGGDIDAYVDEWHIARYCVKDAEDSTSQTNYGVRDFTIQDNMLRTDADCKKRGQTLLYQLKDPPTRIDLEVIGNTNAKIGDRLSLTIPAENISSASYDATTVEHILAAPLGFRTYITTVNSAEVRQPPARSMNEILVRKFSDQKEIAKGIIEVGQP